jgi:hypothetical protein
MYQI